jgi:hypothetical protein
VCFDYIDQAPVYPSLSKKFFEEDLLGGRMGMSNRVGVTGLVDLNPTDDTEYSVVLADRV